MSKYEMRKVFFKKIEALFTSLDYWVNAGQIDNVLGLTNSGKGAIDLAKDLKIISFDEYKNYEDEFKEAINKAFDVLEEMEK